MIVPHNAFPIWTHCLQVRLDLPVRFHSGSAIHSQLIGAPQTLASFDRHCTLSDPCLSKLFCFNASRSDGASITTLLRRIAQDSGLSLPCRRIGPASTIEAPDRCPQETTNAIERPSQHDSNHGRRVEAVGPDTRSTDRTLFESDGDAIVDRVAARVPIEADPSRQPDRVFLRGLRKSAEPLASSSRTGNTC